MKTLEEIKNHVCDVGSNHTEYFGGRYIGGYHIQQEVDEISEFLEFYQDIEVDNYLEIGTCSLGKTRLFCDIIKVRDVYLIDLGVKPYSFIPDLPDVYRGNLRGMKNSGIILQYWGSSQSPEAKVWLETWNIKFNYIFIDGSHETEDVKSDTILAETLLDNCGIMAFHDSVLGGTVKPWIDDMKAGAVPSLVLENEFFRRFGITVFRKKI